MLQTTTRTACAAGACCHRRSRLRVSEPAARCARAAVARDGLVHDPAPGAGWRSSCVSARWAARAPGGRGRAGRPDEIAAARSRTRLLRGPPRSLEAARRSGTSLGDHEVRRQRTRGWPPTASSGRRRAMQRAPVVLRAIAIRPRRIRARPVTVSPHFCAERTTMPSDLARGVGGDSRCRRSSAIGRTGSRRCNRCARRSG